MAPKRSFCKNAFRAGTLGRWSSPSMVEWIVCAKDRVRTFFEKSTASAVADFTQRCDPKDIDEITFVGVLKDTGGCC